MFINLLVLAFGAFVECMPFRLRWRIGRRIKGGLASGQRPGGTGSSVLNVQAESLLCQWKDQRSNDFPHGSSGAAHEPMDLPQRTSETLCERFGNGAPILILPVFTCAFLFHCIDCSSKISLE